LKLIAVRSRKPRALAWILLIIPLALILLYPTIQDYLRAVSLLSRIANPDAKGWIANYDLHTVIVRDESFDFNGRAVPARVYGPAGVAFAPGIVVVHGMHELGIDEPRLVNFARSLAASGFFVMTPLVQGIAEYRVEAESADVIGSAVRSFANQLGTPRVGVLAISFSGGLALLAATYPDYGNSIAWIATVGAHYNLVHVLRFFATGDAVRPDGGAERLTPHEYGPLIVLCDRPGDFFPAQDSDEARAALKLLLSGKGKESEALTTRMSPAGQELMQRIYHKQLDGVRNALLSEIEKSREQLAAASPAGRIGLLPMPILLLHGSDDSVIPPTELLWLRQHVPPERLVGALISPAISHVEVGQRATLRERLALVHWVSLLLRQARNTPTGQKEQLPAGAWIRLPAASP
jgi:pimeloyl-ACP methyl ester carboxylesterase